MKGSTHELVGIVGGVCVARAMHVSLVEAPLVIMSAGLGSLIPDIDEDGWKLMGQQGRRSRIHNLGHKYSAKHPPLALVLGPLLLIGWLLARVLPHRGPSHWLLVAAAAGLGMAWGLYALGISVGFADAIGLSLSVGWILHILCDCMTEKGCAAAAPFLFRRIRILPFVMCRWVSRGSGESVMAGLILLVMGLWLWSSYGMGMRELL